MKRYRLTESRLRNMIREAVKSVLYEQTDEPQGKWDQRPYGFQNDKNGDRIHVNHKGKIDGWDNGEYGWGRIEPTRHDPETERDIDGWERQYDTPTHYIVSKGKGKNKQFKSVPRSRR